MIKHVVCFKLKDNSEENLLKTRDLILSMNGKVSIMKNLEVGVDFLHSPRSFDIILEVLLENKEALDIYQNDPYHCGVVKKYLGEAAKETIAIDYEI